MWNMKQQKGELGCVAFNIIAQFTNPLSLSIESATSVA